MLHPKPDGDTVPGVDRGDQKRQFDDFLLEIGGQGGAIIGYEDGQQFGRFRRTGVLRYKVDHSGWLEKALTRFVHFGRPTRDLCRTDPDRMNAVTVPAWRCWVEMALGGKLTRTRDALLPGRSGNWNDVTGCAVACACADWA
jgi:hypothetical protein